MSVPETGKEFGREFLYGFTEIFNRKDTMRTTKSYVRTLRCRLIWTRVAIVVIRIYAGIAFTFAGVIAIVMLVPLLSCKWLCGLERGRKDVSAPSV